MRYFIHESSYLDDNVSIGEGSKIWHFCHIQSGAKIGSYCTIGQNVNVANGVSIGDRVKIQNNVSIYEGVEIGNDVFCGPSMVFTNDFTPRAHIRRPYLKTVVNDGASIGANATIVCGNSIGKNAMVAAGAVVTKCVKDHALVAGVPAKQIGWVCECGLKLEEDLKCNSCNREYRICNEGLIEIDK